MRSARHIRWSEVKFHQLRLGARFRYRGMVLRKISPLKAAAEVDDLQKLIPRSAEVSPLDERGEVIAQRLPDTLPGARLEAALGLFLAACEHAATRTDPALTDAQRAQLMQALQTAGHDLVVRLAADT
jgi:hypothetical protein